MITLFTERGVFNSGQDYKQLYMKCRKLVGGVLKGTICVQKRGQQWVKDHHLEREKISIRLCLNYEFFPTLCGATVKTNR